jgi:hypothetical protein
MKGRSFMKTSKLLGAVVVLQAVTLAGQWLGTPSYLTSASAQMSDPARDRQQTLDELKSMNAKLDKMISLLSSGDLQVRVIQPDEKKGNAPAR